MCEPRSLSGDFLWANGRSSWKGFDMSMIDKIRQGAEIITLGDKEYNKLQKVRKISQFKEEVKEIDDATKQFIQRNVVNIGKIARSAVRDTTYAETFFTQKELNKLLSRHMDNAVKSGLIRAPKHKNKDEVVKNATNRILQTLLNNKDLCPSYEIGGEKYFTAPDLVNSEAKIAEITGELTANKENILSEKEVRKGQRLYQKYVESQGFPPLEDHKKGIEQVLNSKSKLKIVDGAPGCGKTSIPMGYTAGLMFREGAVNIIATAPTEKAAGGLKQSLNEFVSFAKTKVNKDVNIIAMPLDGVIKKFEEKAFAKDSVVMMDEAGMLGTRTMAKFLEGISSNQMDSFLIGDASQIKPATAGHGFRQVVLEGKKHGLDMVKLSVNLRQKEKGEKIAAKNFRDGSAKEAVEYYEKRRYQGDKPALVFSGQEKDTISRTAQEYVDWRRANPDKKDAIALATNDKAAKSLNRNIRVRLKREGVILDEQKIQMQDGSVKKMALNERVIFKDSAKTSTYPSAEIQSGTSAKILSFTKNKVKLELEDGSLAILRKQKLGAVDYSYALSLKDAQGVTKDAAFVAITNKIDRAEALVAFTRHKDQVITNVSSDAYKDKKELTQSLDPYTKKAIVSDYSRPTPPPPSKYSYASKIRKHIMDEIIHEQKVR
jgi:hypothetical protein